MCEEKDLSAAEYQVVLYPDMALQIYIEGRIVSVPGMETLGNIIDVPQILHNVTMLLPCKTTDGKERIAECAGYILRKNVHQRGPQRQRCDACRKRQKTILKRSRKMGPLERQQNKLSNIRGRYANIRRRNQRLKYKVARLKQKVQSIQDECARCDMNAIAKATSKLPPNQKVAVEACFASSKVKSANGMRYTNQSIYECILLRIKSSKTYEHLRTHKILALPCSKTLERYIKVIEGAYGFDQNVFNVLKQKTARMPPADRHGVLLLDEMKLSKSVTFSKRNLRVQGFTNLGKYTPHDQAGKKGDHALVLMFQPFKGNWVQSVACFLSKGCASGTILHQILIECIIMLERAGLYVDVVASDGASWNRAMWNKFRLNEGEVSTPHVMDCDRRLWFMSDFPHLIKNTRNFLVKHRDNTIWTPDGPVHMKHWKALLKIEDPNKFNLKVNFKLREDHINPQYYQKINVSLAFQFFGVADAMELLRNEHADLKDSAGSQALCRRVKKLIGAMNSRTPIGSMKPGNEAAQTVSEFLAFLIEWENEAKEKKYDFLTNSTCYGLKVSLQAALEICRYVTEVLGYNYLMTARLNQDNLERFFGMMRSCCGSNDHPDSTLFIQMYRLVCTYSLVKPPRGSNVTGGEILGVLSNIKDISDSNERKSQWNAQIDTILARGTNVNSLVDAASILDEHDFFK